MQFHPEATVEIVQSWARMDGEHLAELGITDGESLAADEGGRAAAARTAAFTLFDAFRRRAHPAERSEP